jgi:ketosteroid isomerase-like protein
VLGKKAMRRMTRLACACAVIAAALWQAPAARAQTGDEAQIKALEDQFTAAFDAKNVNAIMKLYVPDQSLFAFDVVPPRQYVGAAAYRKDWENFFNSFDGPVKVEIGDLAITADGNLGYSHSIQHVTGRNKKGEPVDLIVRVTRGYRNVDGHWLVAMDHVSVPVDLDTGKPDLQSKP